MNGVGFAVVDDVKKIFTIPRSDSSPIYDT